MLRATLFMPLSWLLVIAPLSARPESYESKIAFVTLRDGNPEVYAMSPDGSGEVNLTRSPARDESPTWSPDGRRLAFVSDRSGTQAIHTMDAEGSGVELVAIEPLATPGRKGPIAPTAVVWSPDGKRFLVKGSDELFVMNIDGTGAKHLTAARHMCWASRGEEVAFTPFLSKTGYNISLIKPGERTARVLTSVPEGKGMFDWVACAPDGKTFAFCFASPAAGEPSQPYMLDSARKERRKVLKRAIADFGQDFEDPQSKLRRLPKPEPRCRELSLSPDGRWLAFTVFTYTPPYSDIYVVREDGTELKRITTHKAFDHSPAWSPALRSKKLPEKQAK